MIVSPDSPSSLRLDVDSDGKFFWILICGKMAQIVCCTLDACDESLIVDRLRDG